MSNTQFKYGDIMELAVPTGGVTSGGVYLIGGFLGIAQATDATAGNRGNFAVRGVHKLAKTTSETWTEGQPLYWDATNSKLSTDLTLGLPIGAVALAAASADTTGYVRLNGYSLTGRILTVRKRAAVATVNAGFTLVPAVPGAKIRMVDASVIAVGGAATSVTTVDIKGTQSTSVVKLVAFAQASLTQSTQLRSGGAGAAILADGASYVACDANTAVTAGITGSAITVATSIDFLFTYQLEA
jgi:predicted RecA/RadA family phage recombinase